MRGQRTESLREIVFCRSRDDSQLRSDNREISATKRYWTAQNIRAPLKAELRAINSNKKDQQVPTFPSLRRVFPATRERKCFCRLSFIPSVRPYAEFSIAPSFNQYGWKLYKLSLLKR